MQSTQQVDTKNVVKCWKDFLWYFNSLETHRVTRRSSNKVFQWIHMVSAEPLTLLQDYNNYHFYVTLCLARKHFWYITKNSSKKCTQFKQHQAFMSKMKPFEPLTKSSFVEFCFGNNKSVWWMYSSTQNEWSQIWVSNTFYIFI